MRIVIPLILCSLWQATLCTAQCNQLVRVTDCVCPGRNVIYQCSVMGGVFTVYDGSAFQCLNGDITLRNDEFGSAGSIGACDGPVGQTSITGRGLTVVNDCYTSQVNISLGEVVSPSTVDCSIDDGLRETLIDTAILEPSTLTDAPPPPSQLSLSHATSTQLTFTWNPVIHSCPSFVYNISATNCGRCPTITSTASVRCTDFSVLLTEQGQMTCMMSVQSVICNGTSAPIAGNVTAMSYTLKVPNAPAVNITPYYDGQGELIGFDATVTLSDPRPVVISDSVDGSTTSFTLTDNCNVANTINVPESCVDLVCTHYSQMKCSRMSETMTTVAVYASNVLGNGRNSSIINIDNENDFVDIIFALEVNPKEVNCIFLKQSQFSQKTCTIRLSFDNGRQPITRSGVLTSNNIVTIPLNGLPEGSIASYNITASNGTYQVVVRDIMQLPRTDMSVNVGGIVAGVLVTIILAAFVLCVIIVLLRFGPDCWLKVKGFTPLRANYKLRTVDSNTTTENFGKEVAGEDYIQLLQQVYREAEDGETLSDYVKLIVKDKEKALILAINSRVAAERFVDVERKVRPPTERDPDFRNYDVYVGDKSSTRVLPGTKLLYYENNPVTKDVLSDVHVSSVGQLPHGVEELNQWFNVIEVWEKIELFDLFDATRTDNKGPVRYNTKDYGQVGLYFTFEQRMTLRIIGRRRVLAVSHNHRLFKDNDKVLGEKNKIDPDSLPEWKEVYYEALGDLTLNAGSRVLIYNPRLERVNAQYELIIASTSLTVLGSVRQRINKKPRLEHVYQQLDTKKDDIQVEDGRKFMAVTWDDSLYTGSRMSDAVAEEYKWRFVFFQVQEHSMHVPPNTLLLYCTEQ